MEVDIGGWLSIFYQFGSTCSGASFCPANHPLATAFTPRRLHPIRFAYYATIYLSTILHHLTSLTPRRLSFHPSEKKKEFSFGHQPESAIEKDNCVERNHSRSHVKVQSLNQIDCVDYFWVSFFYCSFFGNRRVTEFFCFCFYEKRKLMECKFIKFRHREVHIYGFVGFIGFVFKLCDCWIVGSWINLEWL